MKLMKVFSNAFHIVLIDYNNLFVEIYGLFYKLIFSLEITIKNENLHKLKNHIIKNLK